MAVLGGHFALIMLSPAHAYSFQAGRQMDRRSAKTTRSGPSSTERTRKRERAEPAIPYNVEVVSMSIPGIVHSLAASSPAQHQTSKSLPDQQPIRAAPPPPGQKNGGGGPPFWFFSPPPVWVNGGGNGGFWAIQAKVHIPYFAQRFPRYCDGPELDATLRPALRG